MNRRRWPARTALLLVLLTACGRPAEYLGRLHSGVGEADGAVGAGDAGDGAGDGGQPFVASCDPVNAIIPGPPVPPWNCGERCLREADFPIEPALFQGAVADPDPGHRPRLVYPLAGSLHPPNLSRLTFHWRRGPGAGQNAFLIQIVPAAGIPYRLHLGYRAPAGPNLPAEADAVFEVPERVWRTIGREAAGSEVTITISARDSLSQQVATSDPLPLRFAVAPVEGGLHFVSTEKQRGINRHLFGASGAHHLLPSSPGPTDCVGCHSLSRDGSKLAFAATYTGNLGLVRTADVLTPILAPRPPPDQQRGISPAVSPDGRLLLARDGVSEILTLYDADTGVALSTRTPTELGGRIDYPEWSPDGRSFVATRARQGTQPPRKYSALDGQVVIVPVLAGATGALEIGRPTVAASEPDQIHAHPSWSPDGQWIVFVSSAIGGETNLDPNTRLRLVRAGGGPIATLTSATGGDGNFTTYPKFAPVGQGGCKLLFIVFQSRMNYGLLGRPAAEPVWPQLWLSALDLSEPLAADPSRPPVWLPFQDPRDRNLLPAWSASIPCGADPVCGGGARCDLASGRCVVAPL